MSAASGLQALASRLDRVASGEAARNAATKTAARIDAQAREALSGHRRSGLAESALSVVASERQVSLSQESYLKFHAWWPFRDGLSAEAAAAGAELKSETMALIRG